MKNLNLRQRHWTTAVLLLTVLGLPLKALGASVVVADANGNKLTYSYDKADGPATLTGINAYAEDETKAGHIIIADEVTDANGNTHEVMYVGGSVSNRSNLVSIVFGKNIVSTGGPSGTSSNAFSECKMLKSVKLNTKLQILGTYTFLNCYAMESINLGDCTSLTLIKASAIEDCDYVRELTIPASVETIEKNAFYHIDSLRTVNFAKGAKVTSMGEGTFCYCYKLERINLEDCQQLTTIGNYVFQECDFVREMAIPASVETIGNGAFYSIDSLRTVSFAKGNKLTSMGEGTFRYCYKLEHFNLEDCQQLKTIGGSLLNGSLLKSITVPASVETLGQGTFNGNPELVSLKFEKGSLVKELPRDCIGSDPKLSDLVLPDGLEKIGIGQFWNCYALAEINFGPELKEIVNDYGIFNNCPLRKIVLPGTYYPFNYAYNLQYAVLHVHSDMVDTYRNNNYTKNLHIVALGQPTSASVSTTAGGQLEGKVTAAGDIDNMLSLTVSGPLNGTDINFLHQRMAYLQVLDLKNARIVSGGDQYAIWRWDRGVVTQDGNTTYPTEDNVVGPYMFRDMPTLTELYLPSGTTAIGQCALYQNRNVTLALTKADIPQGVKSIGEYAFSYTGITEAKVPSGVTTLEPYVFRHCEKLQRASLPDGITTIGHSAFSECYLLEEVNMPSAVELIDDYAFYNNNVRTTPLVIPAGCKRIGHYAFRYNHLLPSVKFSEGLQSIGYAAFSQCKAVEALNLPSTITSIDRWAFEYCEAIKEFTFPATITNVPEGILYHCSSLQRVTLAEGTENIGSRAFHDCPNLTLMNYDQPTLRSISTHAFNNTGFTTITLPNTVTSIDYSAFRACQKLESINVPTSIDFVPYDYVCECPVIKRVVMHDGIRRVGHNAFLRCPMLTDVELNDEITTIEYDAFNGCKSYSLTKLPAALTDIQYRAFRGDSALTGPLTIPAGVTNIGSEAFRESGLTGIVLPVTLKRINNYVFQACAALEQIDLPEGLEEIGMWAFDRTGLTSIELPEAIKKVEEHSFSNTQLRTFRVPDSFTGDLGAYSFENCKQMRTIYFGRNQDYSQWSAFTAVYGCDSLQLMRVYAGTPPKSDTSYKSFRFKCVLEVPEDLIPLYQQAYFWKDFKEIRGFYTGDVLRDQDYALLQTLYDRFDGASWTKPWDMENDHHAVGKWAGVTTEKVADLTYAITGIDLSSQQLTGELPLDLLRLKNLQTLNLSRNHLTGDLGQMVSAIAADKRAPLTSVNLQGNAFTGDVYAFAAALPALKELNLSYNRMSEVSQVIPKETLSGSALNLQMQFIDWHTKQLVDEAAPLATQLTAGVPAELELPTTLTYRHDQQDFGHVPTDLARPYCTSVSGNSWSYAWELQKKDGLWNINPDGAYTLHAPKDQPVAYVHDWRTVVLQFTWVDGDVNADQTVDVTDLQSVINYAFDDRKPDGEMFNYGAADVNADDRINVVDIVGSVDYVLLGQQTGASRTRINNMVDMTAANLLAAEGNSLVLRNTAAVAALQLTVAGATERDVTVSDELRSRFTVAMRQAADGLHIVVYSAQGHTLSPGEHQLLTALPAGATVDDVCLSDASAHRMDVGVDASAASGIAQLKADQPGARVYDLSGRPAGPWQQLPEGIYVISVNGKQYKVKK